MKTRNEDDSFQPTAIIPLMLL